MTTTATRSGTQQINGLEMHFEVYGDLDSTRTPLLLIPGAFMSATSMPAWVDAFAERRPVITFDQQGHGRTRDTARAMSYEQFGDDAAALLRVLGVPRADAMGYSQGGGVALQLAIRHPELVGKLVSMSATFRQEGWYPSVIEALGHLTADVFAGSAVETDFKAHTPDDAAFRTYIDKMRVLNRDDQAITDDQMRAISAPTMVIVGDADGVTLEHAVAMFTLRGGGDEEAATTGVLQGVPPARLVVLPATSHIGISGQSEVLVPMITDFLDDVPPTTPDLF